MKNLLPLTLRAQLGRMREPNPLRELLGRIGVQGLHSSIAFGVGARRWSQLEVQKGARVCRNTYFQINTVDSRKRIIIGERVYIGPNSFFSAGERIELGHDCLIGASCVLLSAGHSYDDPTVPYATAPIVSYGSIVLEPNVWMGAGAAIVGGVTVGFGSVIAAGSHVRHSVPPLCLVAGNPMRVLKTYDWKRRDWVRVPSERIALEEHMTRHAASLPSLEEFTRSLLEKMKR